MAGLGAKQSKAALDRSVMTVRRDSAAVDNASAGNIGESCAVSMARRNEHWSKIRYRLLVGR